MKTAATGQVLARLALGAGLVLAACGTTQALSATSISNDASGSAFTQQAIALDEQNEAQRLAEQGRSADLGIGSTFSSANVIRDPENSAWASGFTGSQPVSVDRPPREPGRFNEQ
jgi:hypothetical protein